MVATQSASTNLEADWLSFRLVRGSPIRTPKTPPVRSTVNKWRMPVRQPLTTMRFPFPRSGVIGTSVPETYVIANPEALSSEVHLLFWKGGALKASCSKSARRMLFSGWTLKHRKSPLHQISQKRDSIFEHPNANHFSTVSSSAHLIASLLLPPRRET